MSAFALKIKCLQQEQKIAIAIKTSLKDMSPS